MKTGTGVGVRVRKGVSPRVIQEAALMELPLTELEGLIQAELERNPCLEMDDEDQETEPEERADRERELVELFTGRDEEYVAPPDDDEEEEWNAPSRDLSLWERLEAQAAAAFGNEEAAAARALLDSLDQLCRLAVPVNQIAEEAGLSTELVESVRRRILEFDPVGVAALDSRECLLVQAGRLVPPSHPFIALLSECWEEIEKDGLERCAKVRGHTPEQIETMHELFRRLYINPARKYTMSQAGYVVPEVFIKKVGSRLVVELAEWGIPRVRISPRYAEMLDNGRADPEVEKFLRPRFQRAIEFLKAIQNRKGKVRAVAEFVCRHQTSFLLELSKELQPMTQKEAAETLNIHPSTFNRIVKECYADTPAGIFELRFFFPKPSGSAVTTREEVKQAVKQILENENKAKPLSDEKIVAVLKERGVKVARRSVAVYRQEMGYPGRSRRRAR